MVWSYDPATLPPGMNENNLQVAFYNEVTGQWETVNSVVNKSTHTITAAISHFTTFAVIAPVIPTNNIRLIVGGIIASVIVIALLIIFRRRVGRAFEILFPRLPRD